MTAETKGHTPGPWSLSQRGFVTNDGAVPVMAADGPDDRKRVALVDCQTPYKRHKGHEAQCAERDANARLIAAAPDLLEALKKLAADCLASDFNEHWESFEAALAALKSATGGDGNG